MSKIFSLGVLLILCNSLAAIADPPVIGLNYHGLEPYSFWEGELRRLVTVMEHRPPLSPGLQAWSTHTGNPASSLIPGTLSLLLYYDEHHPPESGYLWTYGDVGESGYYYDGSSGKTVELRKVQEALIAKIQRARSFYLEREKALIEKSLANTLECHAYLRQVWGMPAQSAVRPE